MGIKKDAGDLLKFCYERYREGKVTTNQEFEEVFGWDYLRIKNALIYLIEKGFIGGIESVDPKSYKIKHLQSKVIDIMEDSELFRSTFFSDIE